jgi:hypothetical protein
MKFAGHISGVRFKGAVGDTQYEPIYRKGVNFSRFQGKSLSMREMGMGKN